VSVECELQAAAPKVSKVNKVKTMTNVWRAFMVFLRGGEVFGRTRCDSKPRRSRRAHAAAAGAHCAANPAAAKGAREHCHVDVT
jgi:hypothetical protein